MSEGGPLRLAFVGQSTFFRACVPTEDSPRLVTRFVEFREGADPEPMRVALDGFAADAVVVFRPEIVPAGLLADLPAPVVGFLTEPMPRTLTDRPHPDLAKRARDLRKLDPANVDRLVSFDPFIVPVAEEVMPVWRSLPIPVADRVYRPVRPTATPVRLIFVGRSTAHRETFLAPVKREFDLLHAAFGVGLEEFERLIERHDVCLNLHNEPYPSFENRVCLHLAAGHLVVSEPLSPDHGLQAGRDYLEAPTPDALVAVLRELDGAPERFDDVRRNGRERAEAFRASVVMPQLARQLLADVRQHGSHRPWALSGPAAAA